jgi:SAM-dependent methyltransferase
MLTELEAAKQEAQGRGLVAVDCGAGVGRVTACLLLRHFAQVDLVEPSGHLLEAAQRRLQHESGAPWPPAHKAVGFFRCGLETFEPERGRYDVIWVQWALLYLTDGGLHCSGDLLFDEVVVLSMLPSFVWLSLLISEIEDRPNRTVVFISPNESPPCLFFLIFSFLFLLACADDAVAFFQRCAAALRPGGCIFVKENVCPKGFIVDSEDASVTRSHAYMLELMTKRAGLSLVSTARQRDFPKPLYVVRMYALKPKNVGDSGVN